MAAPSSQLVQMAAAQPHRRTFSRLSVAALEALYLAACEKYGVPPNGSVLISLKTNSGLVKPQKSCVGYIASSKGSTKRKFRENDMLALGELLLVNDASDRDDNAAVVCGTLCKRSLPSLLETHVPAARISAVDLTYAKIGSNGAIFFARILELDKHLTAVSLRNNKIGPRGVAALANSLLTNTTLTSLNLHGNRAYEQGAMCLADSIQANRHRLVALDVSNNHIGHKGVSCITQAVAKCNEARRSSKKNALEPLCCTADSNMVREEVLNSFTHGLGLMFALIGSFVMIYRAWDKGPVHTFASFIYCSSLILLYASSLFYHAFFKLNRIRWIFHRMDTGSVYVLIAGTYTPIALIPLHGPLGIFLATYVWSLALVGILVDAFYFKMYPKLTVTLYVAMGWSVLLIAKPFWEQNPLGFAGGVLLLLGGIFYTGGVYFFVRDGVHPLYHAVWHIFVLLGSVFHYLCIYFYVLTKPLPLEYFGGY